MNDNNPIKQRLHIYFGKYDALIYTSNLDVAKTWERVLRRANLPILYSQGFNTRPRIVLASALPLGISSECEILDVSMRESIELEGLSERIQATSPSGLRINKIVEVPIRSATLPTRVRSSEYRIHFEDPIDLTALQQRIDRLMASETLFKLKDIKDRPSNTNVRPLVYDLHIDEKGDLIAHLSVGDRGNLRPDEILNQLGMGDAVVSIHRYQLYIDPE